MSRTIRLVGVICILTLLPVVTAGCTRSRGIWVTPYERGSELTVRPAPESGVYKVKWAVERDGRSFGIQESQTVVRAGDPLGFVTEQDGSVVALAGRQEMTLGRLHPEARFCVWSCEIAELTPLGQSMRTLGSSRFDAGVLLDVIVSSAFDALSDDDDDDDDDRSTRNEKEDDREDAKKLREARKDRGDRYSRKLDDDDDRVRLKRD